MQKTGFCVRSFMEIEPPSIEIILSLEYQQSLRKLAKKYRNIRSNLDPVIQALQNGDLVGDRIQGLESVVVFKVRVQNSDAQRGKSGGYRLVYELRSSTSIAILAIYSKSEREDIRADEVQDILNQFDEYNGQ